MQPLGYTSAVASSTMSFYGTDEPHPAGERHALVAVILQTYVAGRSRAVEAQLQVEVVTSVFHRCRARSGHAQSTAQLGAPETCKP